MVNVVARVRTEIFFVVESRMRNLAWALLLFYGLCASVHACEHADRIFLNGRIWTGEDGKAVAEAMAICGDRILALGRNAEMRKLRGPETAMVDLKGWLVVPGFNDAHWHFMSSLSQQADLADVRDVKELQTRLTEHAKSHPGTGWLLGFGWGYAAFPDQIPHRKYLDEIFPDRPVFIYARDGHMALANSKALSFSMITRDTPDPEGGRIERNAQGELTGELKESALELIERHVPEPSNEEIYRVLKSTLDRAASYGLTSVQNASGRGLSSGEMAALERVMAEGSLKLRFYAAVPFLKHPAPEDLERFKALKATYRGPLLKFGSAKGMLDGTVDARTAAMFQPYVGSTDTGIPMWTQEELNRSVAIYDREGFQVQLHAIGDKAIHMALDAYENAAKQNGTSGRRHRVEHIEVPAISDYPRFAALGVIASTQALFANPDETTLGNYAVLLGPERASRANAFKHFDDAGAVQAFGSDYPVFSMEVLRGIYCAVTRMTPTGTPKGGWYPQNRISVEAALRHFTRDAAYASFDEHVKGTLSAGKLADFVVLSENILQGPRERILKSKVLLTVMGGRETYRARDSAAAGAGIN
jgi:predicted amidohydrolase YtcJ